jgi:hypothetical protein
MAASPASEGGTQVGAEAKTPAWLQAHRRKVARCVELVAFIRACTEEGEEPKFHDIARLARARGLFSDRRRGLFDVEATLMRTWAKRSYYDSAIAANEFRFRSDPQ